MNFFNFLLEFRNLCDFHIVLKIIKMKAYLSLELKASFDGFFRDFLVFRFILGGDLSLRFGLGIITLM